MKWANSSYMIQTNTHRHALSAVLHVITLAGLAAQQIQEATKVIFFSSFSLNSRPNGWEGEKWSVFSLSLPFKACSEDPGEAPHGAALPLLPPVPPPRQWSFSSFACSDLKLPIVCWRAELGLSDCSSTRYPQMLSRHTFVNRRLQSDDAVAMIRFSDCLFVPDTTLLWH